MKFIGGLILILTSLSSVMASGKYCLVQSGQSCAYLLLGDQPSWQDKFASEELVTYIKKMTGARLPIYCLGKKKSIPESDIPILLGQPKTNKIIAELAERGKIEINEKKLTEEGFIIKTTLWQKRPCLVIAGVSNVATIYAAYDLLERFGRIGFFRYEEHIPKRSNFVIPTCDIREKPFFSTRMHGGQYHYYGIHFYSEAQWKEDLRWYAKYRLNRHNYLPGPPVVNLLDYGMWKRLGIKTAARQEPRDRKKGYALKMLKHLVPYALKLGVRSPYPTTDGKIPNTVLKEFKHTYPKVRTFELVRNGRHNTYVDPADPMWLRLNQARLENMIASLGDSRLYYLPSPWAERAPGKRPQEKERLTRDYANAVGQLVKWAEEKHPGAEWVMDCWAVANKTYWQPYRVKRMLGALPQNLNLVIWDYPAEDEPSYVYNSYWFNRPWAFIVFNSMAGNTAVQGDVSRIMGNLYRVLCDQRADKMIGFGWYTEARDYVPFYKDLVLHLAWNPLIALDDFIRDYCERRYQPESVPAMILCHKKMLKTVYGPQSNTHLTDGFRTVTLMNPVYWHQLGGNWVPFDELQRRKTVLQRHWAPILADALADALTVYDNEQSNPCYIRDLVDLMRSYIHVQINQAVWDAIEATRHRNLKDFEMHYAHINRLFDYLLQAINLVAHRWEFGVNALIRDFRDAPLNYSPKEIRHYLYYVTWRGNKIYDYFRSDRYEMIRDIYRPMTMAFLDACREQIKKGTQTLPLNHASGATYKTIMDVTATAKKIASTKYQLFINRFINGPCQAPPAGLDAKKVAHDFLEAVRAGRI